MPKQHIIRAGDSLANIAYENGMLAQTVWDSPDNQALRDKRQDMNILMPGDVLVIPDKRLGKSAIATGQRHRFRLKDVPHLFRLQLFDDELPRATQSYTLKVRSKTGACELSGATDAQGLLTAFIPPGAIDGRLSIAEGEHEALELDILFGSLDPVDELSGVQKRLNNLGFTCPVDGQLCAATRAAIEAYQRRFALPVTGQVDAELQRSLVDMHEAVSEFPEEPPEPKA